jgi:hypothetical protein
MRHLPKNVKTLLIFLSLLIPLGASAKEGFWLSNRTRVGYDQLFISIQFKLSREPLPTLQTSFDAGALWKINDVAFVEPSYVLKLPKFNDGAFEHQFRLSLKLIFK